MLRLDKPHAPVLEIFPQPGIFALPQIVRPNNLGRVDIGRVVNPLAKRVVTGPVADDRQVLDFVIESTSPLNWNEFVKLVYSTYPIVTQPRFSKLDLVAIAQRYRRDQQIFGWNGDAPTGDAPDGAESTSRSILTG